MPRPSRRSVVTALYCTAAAVIGPAIAYARDGWPGVTAYALGVCLAAAAVVVAVAALLTVGRALLARFLARAVRVTIGEVRVNAVPAAPSDLSGLARREAGL